MLMAGLAPPWGERGLFGARCTTGCPPAPEVLWPSRIATRMEQCSRLREGLRCWIHAIGALLDASRLSPRWHRVCLLRAMAGPLVVR